MFMYKINSFPYCYKILLFMYFQYLVRRQLQNIQAKRKRFDTIQKPVPKHLVKLKYVAFPLSVFLKD